MLEKELRFPSYSGGIRSNIEFLLSVLEDVPQYKMDGTTLIIPNDSFVKPLTITPLANVFCDLGNYRIENGYCEHIGFPHGTPFKAVKSRPTYIPLVKVEMNSPEDREEQLNTICDKYGELIHNSFLDDRFKSHFDRSTMSIMMSEIFDNIVEHSQAETVHIFSQNWPKIEMCEICIVDNGIGLFNSLKNAGRNVTDSIDAMKKVIEDQLSSKKEATADGEHHGMGIRTTQNILCNSDVRGSFTILSGESAFVNNHGNKTYYSIVDYSYPGTVISLRIRKPRIKIDWKKHVEVIYKY